MGTPWKPKPRRQHPCDPTVVRHLRPSWEMTRKGPCNQRLVEGWRVEVGGEVIGGDRSCQISPLGLCWKEVSASLGAEEAPPSETSEKDLPRKISRLTWEQKGRVS